MSISVKQPDKTLDDDDLMFAWLSFDGVRVNRKEVLEKDTFDMLFASIHFPKSFREDYITVGGRPYVYFTTTDGMSLRILPESCSIVISGLEEIPLDE